MYMNGIPPEKKTRPAESPEAALIRKIKEDLNIDVTVGSRINTTEYDYPAIHLSMDAFNDLLANISYSFAILL